MRLFRNLIFIWGKFYKEYMTQLQRIRFEDSEKLKNKIHFMKLHTDDEYRKEFELKRIKEICKQFEENANGTERNDCPK